MALMDPRYHSSIGDVLVTCSSETLGYILADRNRSEDDQAPPFVVVLLPAWGLWTKWHDAGPVWGRQSLHKTSDV